MLHTPTHLIPRATHPAGEDTAVFSQPVGEDTAIRLQDFWLPIRKRIGLISIFSLGVVFSSALVLLMMTRIYTAETTLLIKTQEPQVLDIQQVLSESLGIVEKQVDYYKTQVAILNSRSIAAQVIKGLGLESNSLFTGEGEGENSVTRRWAEAKAWVRGFFPAPPPVDTTGSLGVDPALVDTYADMLGIGVVPETSLVTIAFSSPDPALSARVANAHAQAYISQGIELRTQASREALSFLEKKQTELRARIENSEAALNRFRRDKKIISLDEKENIVIQRLADLNQRLTAAETDRIVLEATAGLAHNRTYDSLPAVIDSPLIQTLKQTLASLEGEAASLASRFGPNYPRLIQLQAQVEENRRRLFAETGKVVAGIQSAYLAAQARENDLRVKMEQQKAAALNLKDASVEYAILRREVDSNTELYNSVLQRLKETGLAAELRVSNVSVIDKAEPPLTFSEPKIASGLLLSCLVGLMGGVGLAFFLEYLDDSFKTPQEVERYLQLPRLGVVPDFNFLSENRNSDGGTYYFPIMPTSEVGNGQGSVSQKGESSGTFSRALRTSADYEEALKRNLILSRSVPSEVSDAYRTLRTAIMLSRAEEPPRTILFTSGVQGEGKTTTLLNTALVFVQMGVRVLVIDADLRRSDCHKVLGVKNGLGLTEVLTGQRELYEVIKPLTTDPVFLFHLLSSGTMPPNPTDLVGSRKMKEVLTVLQKQYDYIFIDSPPAVLVSDAALLSTMVDGVVFVVSCQGTQKQVAREALTRLRYARANVLGVVVNRVDARNSDYVYYA